MIIDFRKQERTIKIELSIDYYNFDLDRLVNELVEEIKIVCEQRNLPEKLKLEIILE